MSKLGSATIYRERVLPPIGGIWPILLVIPALYVTFLPFNVAAGAILGPAAALAIYASFWLAAPVIEVTQDDFSVGHATAPRSVLGEALSIARVDAFAERGVKLSPAAFIRFQVGVKGLVKVEIRDENDPTPYWLVATNKPKALVAALAAKEN